MLDEQETIIPSSPGYDDTENELEKKRLRKKMFFKVGLIILIILGLGIWWGIKVFFNQNKVLPPVKSAATTSPVVLSELKFPNESTSTVATSTFPDLAVEYLTFSNFYIKPTSTIDVAFKDYEFPLNVKIDVSNYYSLSRKLNIDPVIDNLNNSGLATISNPWEKEAPDFYSLYANLEDNQIPVLITSDFMIYYYQTISKQIFKDIEENIFYDNLWSINKNLYESAKNRYEARLASIGNINDSILEGERLETAFFAVALELLKPTASQILPKDKLDDKNKFSLAEADNFSFVTPPYLRDDVLKEVKLIRDSQEKTKSPVMLYDRDYKDFVVPIDYHTKAKLNNFYLTTKWLNSIFPLNYRNKTCVSCLLDKSDWRLSMIAASFISSDFSDSPELKNDWARIYKVMSYFNPLRDDLNYVYYRDSLKSVFGDNYNIETLFDDKNKDAQNNLAKLQAKLNSLEFSPFLGSLDKNDSTVNYRRGFKMLVESYSPNDYIFSQLTYPKVSVYQETNLKPKNNVTACQIKPNNVIQRCNGFAFDVINLLQPISENDYFTENTSYLNYGKEMNNLKDKFNKDAVWHTANYWSNLSILSAYLNSDKTKEPIFARSTAWRNQTLITAVSAWVNMQLPAEKFSFGETNTQSLNNFSQYSENSYVDPNLNLINELLANSAMMQKMFAALQIDKEVISVSDMLKAFDNDLAKLKEIAKKELSGQTLVTSDNEFINNFARQLTITPSTAPKQLIIRSTNKTGNLIENISHLKLMVLTHQDGENKVFSVGPVWSYLESR
jgi:hypothetical protein